MQRWLCIAMVAVLVLTPQIQAQGNKKPQKGKVEAQVATAADYAWLNNNTSIQLVGQITNIDLNGRVITFRVEYQVPEAVANQMNGNQGPNPNPKNGNKNPQQPKLPRVNPNNNQAQKALQEAREQQQFQREYQQIMQLRNPVEQQRRLAQLMQRIQRDQQQDLVNYMRQMQQQQGRVQGQGGKTPGQPNVKMVTIAKEFELEFTKDIRAARAQLEPEYDTKGNLKVLSAAEQQKLRDAKLPGFKAKFEEVMAGQQARLFLAKRATTASAPKKVEKKEPADKEGEKAEKAEKGEKGGIDLPADVEHAGPRVTGVLILQETTLQATPEKKKKKN